MELEESETGTGTETGAETGTGMDNQMGGHGVAALGQSLSHHLDVPVMGSIFERNSIPHCSSSDPIIALEILMAVILTCHHAQVRRQGIEKRRESHVQLQKW